MITKVKKLSYTLLAVLATAVAFLLGGIEFILEVFHDGFAAMAGKVNEMIAKLVAAVEVDDEL